MRPPKSFPPNSVERLKTLLNSAQSVSEFKKIQSVYLRAKLGYNAQQIAEITGLKLQTVRNLHAAYLKDGEACLKPSKKKGGRKHFYLTIKQEKAFLARFEERGKTGSLLEASQIHTALQQKLNVEIPLSTTYRMLHRHGWRKLAPRPKHSKGNALTRKAFKKTLEASFLLLSYKQFQKDCRFDSCSKMKPVLVE